MAKRALLLVDIQNDYFDGGKWTLNEMDAAAENAAKLLTSARETGDLVVHVRHEFPSEDAPFFVPGSEGAQHRPVVAPLADEPVVLKNGINAFQGTSLKDTLDEAGVEEVTICGAMSHMCIDAATRAAADHGYQVTLVHDACATHDQEFGGVTVPAAQVHAAFMAALGFAYANAVSTEDYLA